MFVVGLTGGIGSGKTAASDYFKQLGIDIVDADVASRIVVEPGKPALENIAEHFGQSLILKNGELNRAALRQRIFSNPVEKSWLESLLHPLIAKEIDRQIANALSPYVIFVSPLLLETKQHQRCKRVLVVDADVETQVTRASERDKTSEELIRAIIMQQMPREARLDRADDILRNDGDLNTLHKHIEKLHRQYLELAAQDFPVD
jgi:dephospho-CoA kinase